MTLQNCCCPAGKKLPTHKSLTVLRLDSASSSDFEPSSNVYAFTPHKILLTFKFYLSKALSIFSLFLIGIYRSVFTAHFGAGVCRFEPTCSAYANQAFLEYPFLVALKLTAKRLGKCYPGSSFGYDPLPSNIIQTNYPTEITHECR